VKLISCIFLPLTLAILTMAAMLVAGPVAKADEGPGKKPAAAARPGSSGLPTPRFVSVSADIVNMRAGPGVRYPITWVSRRRGVPLLVMAEYDYWRKVRDADGTEGWMHRSLLSGRRMAMLRAGVSELRNAPKDEAPVILRAEAGVIGRLFACQGAWCRIELNDTSAWLPRTDIFGALPTEQFQ
jgi:SH3-like domain-containing protein